MKVQVSEELQLSQVGGLYRIGAWVRIPAKASEVFELLADPRKHDTFDGSGTVKGMLSGPNRLYLNAVFSMDMKMIVPYRIQNRVIEFEEGRKIAWCHIGRHVWRYLLEDDGAQGCKVTEIFDWERAYSSLLYEMLQIPERNGRAIVATLTRLRDQFI